MSVAQAALAVTAGSSYPVYVGTPSTVGAVVVLNESPYGLNVSNGASSQWIAAQTADLVACDSAAFSGTLTITTDNYLSNASSAPSFIIYLTAFAPGEAIRASYPAALSRLTNGGNVGIASQLVQDGLPSGTSLIEAKPSGASQSQFTADNAGNMDLYGVLTEHNSYVLHPAATPQPFLTIYMPDNANPQFLMTGTAVPGSYNGMNFWAWENGAAAGLFGIGSQQGGSAAAFVDGAGVLHARGPMILNTGYQETGVAGFACYVNGILSPSIIKNFKTVMTNTPSSITSTNLSAPTNAGGLGLNLITKYGFNMFWGSVGAGLTGWNIQYTTVGNTLLAVNATGLDHHCSGCDAVARGVPFTALASHLGATPAESALSYTCPGCGRMEHFNCGLTPSDAADPSPQGSGQYATTRGAQATLIRQLMTAVGLPVAASATGTPGVTPNAKP